MLAGARFLPPAVMIRCFLRSVMRRIPLRVELADVAGLEPAVDDRLGGRLGVLEVAGEHQRTAEQDLAVVGDPAFHRRHRPADGAQPDRALAVGVGHHRRLGHAVGLVDRQPCGPEELEDLERDRRRAGDAGPHPAAEGGVDLAEDQEVGEPVAERQGPRAPAGRRAGSASAGGRGRPPRRRAGAPGRPAWRSPTGSGRRPSRRSAAPSRRPSAAPPGPRRARRRSTRRRPWPRRC